MGKRNQNIEIARYVFAFMVVCIHVPFFLSSSFMPLLRCAVPFFYIITGYYLVSSDKDTFIVRLRNSLKHYASLWLCYLIVFSFLAIVIRYCVHDQLSFSFTDIKKFLRVGFCDYISHITISGKTFGISHQIWFLYGGMISLAFLELCSKYWFTRLFNILIASCATIPFIISWLFSHKMPQIIYISIPAIYAGMCIRYYEKKLEFISNKHYILFGAICLFLSYLQFWSFRGSNSLDAMLFTIPLTSILFVLMLRLPVNYEWGGQNLPSQTTMDIYIWHLFANMILSGVLSINLHGLDALIIYVLCALVSIILRKLRMKLLGKY